MNDKELREAVEQELGWEPSIKAAGIGVTVSEGVVTLSGHVDTYPEKHKAERVAARVRGVRGVAGELEVRLPGLHVRSDDEIAQAAANTIEWDAVLPRNSIKVCVENGRVTLEGTVNWQFQRLAAARAMRNLIGVRDVNNHIAIRPSADPDSVKAEIDAALKRNAELDAQTILVEARGSQVLLWGNVRSWIERVEAERAAWACPGVTEVENNIDVSTLVGAM